MTPEEALQKALEEFDHSPTALARAIGDPVKRQNVEYWLNSPSGVPVEHCPAVERVTNGKVTRRHLRPYDWHRVWPELVTDEFPAPQEAA